MSRTERSRRQLNAALHVRTQVLPGRRVEIATPELPEGEVVDAILLVRERTDRPHQSALDVIESLHGHRSFQTAEEVDQFLREERSAWDR